MEIQAPDIAPTPQVALPQAGNSIAGLQNAPPPPPAPPAAKPKLTFESVGSQTGSSQGSGVTSGVRIETPRATAEDAARAVARGQGGGAAVVGDMGEIMPFPRAQGADPVPGQNRSRLELLSDPMGVDFRPYLIQVLAAVRRNWFAVIPESARLGGRSGRVTVQFAIAKDGSVPKLVIASGSGADALDRAAVAGISASNPFPPLPAEFKGQQIRLQLAFGYNQPRQ
jgi:TonB family protein